MEQKQNDFDDCKTMNIENDGEDNAEPISISNNQNKIGIDPEKKRHTKKEILMFVGTVVLISAIICVIAIAFGNKDDVPKDLEEPEISQSDVNKKTIESEQRLSEDIDLILSRKLYFLKEDFPELYTNDLFVIEETRAYIEDWLIKDILNEENFRNISWEYDLSSDKSRLVIFNGEGKTTPNNSKIRICFAVQDNSAAPLILECIIYSDNDVTKMSVQDHLDIGEEEELAVFTNDILISIMISLFDKDSASYPEGEISHDSEAMDKEITKNDSYAVEADSPGSKLLNFCNQIYFYGDGCCPDEISGTSSGFCKDGHHEHESVCWIELNNLYDGFDIASGGVFRDYDVEHPERYLPIGKITDFQPFVDDASPIGMGCTFTVLLNSGKEYNFRVTFDEGFQEDGVNPWVVNYGIL